MNKIIIIVLVILFSIFVFDFCTNQYLLNIEFFQTTQPQQTSKNCMEKLDNDLESKIKKYVVEQNKKSNDSNETTNDDFSLCYKYLQEKNYSKICSYNLCKDYIGNCNIEKPLITFPIIDAKKYVEENEDHIKNQISSKIDEKIRALFENQNKSISNNENTISELLKFKTKQNNLMDNIFSQEIYKNDYNKTVKELLNNQMSKNEDDIKRTILDNKVNQIHNLINIIEKQNKKDDKLLIIKNIYNNKIVLNVRTVSRYYNKSDHRLLDLPDVIRRQNNNLENTMYLNFDKNDYYNILFNDNILYYEPRNIKNSLPCLVKGQCVDKNCPDYPNNMNLTWHMKLTNGYQSNKDLDNIIIRKRLQNESSNNIIYNMDYSSEVKAQGGYFYILKIDSMEEFITRFSLENDEFQTEFPFYVCVPVENGFENNTIKKILVYEDNNLVILDTIINNITKKAFWKSF